jgi:hypothetical protein
MNTTLPVICCPSCGAKIKIAAKEVQTELPLGPFSFTKKLDGEKGDPSIMNHHFFDDDNKAAPLNLKDALRHPYWKKFARYCETRSGNPTLKGFCTWLAHQAPPPIRQARPISISAAPLQNMSSAGPEIAESLRQWRTKSPAARG